MILTDSKGIKLVQIAYNLRALFAAGFQEFTRNIRKGSARLLTNLYNGIILWINALASVQIAELHADVSKTCLEYFRTARQDRTFHSLSSDTYGGCLGKNNMFQFWYICFAADDI